MALKHSCVSGASPTALLNCYALFVPVIITNRSFISTKDSQRGVTKSYKFAKYDKNQPLKKTVNEVLHTVTKRNDNQISNLLE